MPNVKREYPDLYARQLERNRSARFADGARVAEVHHEGEGLESVLLDRWGDERVYANLGGGGRWVRAKAAGAA